VKTEERLGILGLETEHVVLYIPEGADESTSESEKAPRPPFELLQVILFDCLLEGRKAAVSSGIKGGYFLENGGLVHLEIFLHSQADAPILEVCTPECRNAWDLLTYSRAYDELLEETSRRSQPALLEHGYKGRIAFGKNNLDARGVGFGCHENYLVHTRQTRLQRAVQALCAPLLLLSYFPVFLLFVFVVALGFSWLILTKALPPVETLASNILQWIKTRYPTLIRYWNVCYFVTSAALLYPFIQCYSLLVRFLAFGNLIRQLTPFLMTRQILTGAGTLNFHKGAYELSQRASLTRRLSEIVMFGRHKTVYDLKGFLFDRSGFFHINAPLALFKPTKKLTVAVGDSNIADDSNLLKLGVTTLILEMIEAGESFDELRLSRPVKALQAVSLGGPWKALRLRSGKTLTPIAVQREYLSRTRAFFKDREPGGTRHTEILELWENSLDKLSDRQQGLASSLDWVAKKSILDQAVLAQTNWKVFFAWGKLFTLAGLERAAAAESFHELMSQLSFLKRLWLKRHSARWALDPSEYSMQKDLHFQARKIDCRYHELGGGTSYQRALECHELMHRRTHKEEVARAIKEPPRDTRARVRGYYIQKSRRPELLQVNWNAIELLSPWRHIPTPDPFYHRLPTD
jgi:proteasome accessory factor A